MMDLWRVLAAKWVVAHAAGVGSLLLANSAAGSQVDLMTYVGGGDREQAAHVAVDQDGNILMTGSTFSANFEGAINSPHGGEDAFAIKLTPEGEVLWMAYFGGAGSDTGHAIASAGLDEIIVIGWTDSTDFGGRVNSFHGGPNDAFVLKFSPSTGVQWMRYCGGSDDDYGYQMALGKAGDAIVVGHTDSIDFEGAVNAYYGGDLDAFLLRVSSTGDQTFMRYLGGDDKDRAYGVDVDANGDALVGGTTESLVIEGQTNSHHGSRTDAFALKIDPAGTIGWMTYLGGSSGEHGRAIAVDDQGNSYVTGNTWSPDFEGRLNGHFGMYDTFAAKVDPDGTLQWMRYLGGTDPDGGHGLHGVAVVGANDILFAGTTSSSDFDGAINSAHGGLEGVVSLVTSSGDLGWSMFVGGSARDLGFGIACDPMGQAWFVGGTNSDDFEGRINALYGGDSDAFAVRIPVSDAEPAALTDVSVAFGSLISGGIPELEESDNERLRGRSRFGFTAFESNLFDLRIGAETTVIDPLELEIVIEGRLSVSGICRVRLRNWTTNSLQQVHQYAMGMSETTETIQGVAAGELVRAPDGRIELALRQSAIVVFTANGFDSFTDFVRIAVE